MPRWKLTGLEYMAVVRYSHSLRVHNTIRMYYHCSINVLSMTVFSLSYPWLQEAGVPTKLAPTIGIAVDHRRKNRSLEGLQENVNRLKAYRASLVLFPRRNSKPKAGDATAADLATVQQVGGTFQPIQKAMPTFEYTTVTPEMAVRCFPCSP